MLHTFSFYGLMQCEVGFHKGSGEDHKDASGKNTGQLLECKGRE